LRVRPVNSKPKTQNPKLKTPSRLDCLIQIILIYFSSLLVPLFLSSTKQTY
jgi:hypothetical protein